MRALLLDTCAMLSLAGVRSIRPAVSEAIRQAGGAKAVFVSPYSAWEIGMLVAKGRLNLGMRPEAWFDAFMARPQLTLAALTPAILIASNFLPGAMHGDLADRILTATAREFGFTIVTRDRALLSYAEAGHINAIEC